MRTTKTILIFFILLFFTIGCDLSKKVENQNDTKTLYENIVDRGKIRVGYISYPPSYIVNTDGTHSGIFHETFEKIAENLGLEIEYTKEVTWDGMIQDVKDRKVDIVITGIWPTSQRGKHVDFRKSIYILW